MQLLLPHAGPTSLQLQAHARSPSTVNNLLVQQLLSRLKPISRYPLLVRYQTSSSTCCTSTAEVSMSAVAETINDQKTRQSGHQDTTKSAPDKHNPSYSIHPSSGLTSFQQHDVLNVERNWQGISCFWKEAVAGRLSLQDLSPPINPPEHYCPDMQLCNQHGSIQDQTAANDGGNASQQEEEILEQQPKRRRKQDRCTYKVLLAYYGPAFDGFAVQNGSQMVTVQGSLCEVLQPLLGPTTKAQVSGAGRTDKGVSALGQVFSFYSWTPLSPSTIANAIASTPHIPEGSIRAVAISPEQRSFHANFAATWRRYVYLLPLRKPSTCQPTQEEGDPELNGDESEAVSKHAPEIMRLKEETKATGSSMTDNQQLERPPVHAESSLQTNDNSPEATEKQRQVLSMLETEDVSPEVANRLLQTLVGVPLDYSAYARDTPKGKDTTCTLSMARASRVRLPDSCGGGDALCVELVANRFLRKMVRVLVGTLVMESLAVQSSINAIKNSQHQSSEGQVKRDSQESEQGTGISTALNAADNDLDICWDGMLKHCGPDASRSHTSVPAPAEGLCFAGVGYGDIQAV